MNGIAVKFRDPRCPKEFWRRVVRLPGPAGPNGKCWHWVGARNPYGQFQYGGRNLVAHRYAWEQLVCKIPEGLCIDHLCLYHNCVNPSHLQPVTIRENNRRYYGYFNSGDDKCVRGHKLEDVSNPYCGECQRVRNKFGGSQIRRSIYA